MAALMAPSGGAHQCVETLTVQHSIGGLQRLLRRDDSPPGPRGRPGAGVHIHHPFLGTELVVADWRVRAKDVSSCVRVHWRGVVLGHRHLKMLDVYCGGNFFVKTEITFPLGLSCLTVLANSS